MSLQVRRVGGEEPPAFLDVGFRTPTLKWAPLAFQTRCLLEDPRLVWRDTVKDGTAHTQTTREVWLEGGPRGLRVKAFLHQAQTPGPIEDQEQPEDQQ